MLLILQAAQFVATLGCAVFAGAAIYISAVEHPARMRFDTKTAAALWAPSYRRATLMQAPLAVASALAGVAAWLLGGGAADDCRAQSVAVIEKPSPAVPIEVDPVRRIDLQLSLMRCGTSR